MAENNPRFLFTFSEEGTRQLQAGKVVLSSGGLRKPDGSMLEMAKPVLFEPVEQDNKPRALSVEEQFASRLNATNRSLELIMKNTETIKNIAWMNYAVNCRTYEMTYQGFQIVINQLNGILSEITSFRNRYENDEFYKRIERVKKYKSDFVLYAEEMDDSDFVAGRALRDFASFLNDVRAFLDTLFDELVRGSGNEEIILSSIVFLMQPYCYVLRRFSMLFYYEKGRFPANYDEWVGTAERIARDARFKNRIQHYLRVNSDCSLEDMYVARDKALFNIRGCVRQISFDNRYVLGHTKEQYLTIDKQLEMKAANNDYKIINGHACIELE